MQEHKFSSSPEKAPNSPSEELQLSQMMDIITKVQKMLARSTTNGASEEEANTAMILAHQMLAKHGLDMQDVQAAKDRSKAASKPIGHEVGEELQDWEIRVIHATGRLYFCSGILVRKESFGSNGRKKPLPSYKMVGQRHNVVVASMMCEYFLNAIERMSLSYYYRGKKYQKQWMDGCASRMSERLEEKRTAAGTARERRENSPDGLNETNKEMNNLNLPALVGLYKDQEQMNKQFIDEEIGKIRGHFAYKGIKDSPGFKKGKIDGDKISLNSQIGKCDGTSLIAGREKSPK